MESSPKLHCGNHVDTGLIMFLESAGLSARTQNCFCALYLHALCNHSCFHGNCKEVDGISVFSIPWNLSAFECDPSVDE